MELAEMSQTDASTLSKKIKFLLLTFVVSGAVIFGMVAVGGRADGQDSRTLQATTSPSPADAGPDRTGTPSGQKDDRVVNAQRTDERELALPPGKKGPDASLY